MFRFDHQRKNEKEYDKNEQSRSIFGLASHRPAGRGAGYLELKSIRHEENAVPYGWQHDDGLSSWQSGYGIAAGLVRLLPALADAAHDHIVDRVRVDTGAPHDGIERERGQIDRVNTREARGSSR